MQKKLSSTVICQKKVWSLGFVKDSNRSQREKFSVFLEREYWLWVLFHVFVAILIKAPLPYVVAVTVGIFRWTLAANELSWLWQVEENVNQLLKMGSNLLLTYLLRKRQFSILILSGWALRSLKWISLNSFFWSIKSRLIVHTFCPHNEYATQIGHDKLILKFQHQQNL